LIVCFEGISTLPRILGFPNPGTATTISTPVRTPSR
jgi:hypothetical protein